MKNKVNIPLSFPKLREKCEPHVCLIDNEYGDERWEDVFAMSREEKDHQCREDRTTLETLYHQETENARLNPRRHKPTINSGAMLCLTIGAMPKNPGDDERP